ncbi:MAG: polyprenyl diphosphate synthase [bacterium]|nr:polyprenyl diphosphate synthase [bacterium]
MENIPKHIVLFPDGNRRWARERGLHPLEGHLAGKNNLEEFLRWAQKRGVAIVTVFGFSTENWNRSPEEVDYLMTLLETYLGEAESIAKFQEQGMRVCVIGQKDRLRPSLQNVITDVEEQTKNNTGLRLNVAVSYGGRWDIVQAAQRAMQEGVAPAELTEERFASYLSTAGLADPDLVIRPGGEMRFSNFLLWQAAYAELYFTSKYWPDFTEQDLDDALAEYAKRQRRFGH